MSGILYSIIIGGIAGWLAGNLMKGGGFGLLVNIILGIVGAAVGNWLLTALGVNFMEGVVGDLIKGLIGAGVVLLIVGLFKK